MKYSQSRIERNNSGGKINATALIVPALFVQFLGIACRFAIADVRLPAIEGDAMVLQQQSTTIFWGWAAPGEHVSVTPSWGKAEHCVPGADGKWVVKLPTGIAQSLEKDLHPETITVAGKNQIVLKDILIGEVCSRMELQKAWAHSAAMARSVRTPVIPCGRSAR